MKRFNYLAAPTKQLRELLAQGVPANNPKRFHDWEKSREWRHKFEAAAQDFQTRAAQIGIEPFETSETASLLTLNERLWALDCVLGKKGVGMPDRNQMAFDLATGVAATLNTKTLHI